MAELAAVAGVPVPLTPVSDNSDQPPRQGAPARGEAGPTPVSATPAPAPAAPPAPAPAVLLGASLADLSPGTRLAASLSRQPDGTVVLVTERGSFAAPAFPPDAPPPISLVITRTSPQIEALIIAAGQKLDPAPQPLILLTLTAAATDAGPDALPELATTEAVLALVRRTADQLRGTDLPLRGATLVQPPALTIAGAMPAEAFSVAPDPAALGARLAQAQAAATAAGVQVAEADGITPAGPSAQPTPAPVPAARQSGSAAPAPPTTDLPDPLLPGGASIASAAATAGWRSRVLPQGPSALPAAVADLSGVATGPGSAGRAPRPLAAGLGWPLPVADIAAPPAPAPATGALVALRPEGGGLPPLRASLVVLDGLVQPPQPAQLRGTPVGLLLERGQALLARTAPSGGEAGGAARLIVSGADAAAAPLTLEVESRPPVRLASGQLVLIVPARPAEPGTLAAGLPASAAEAPTAWPDPWLLYPLLASASPAPLQAVPLPPGLTLAQQLQFIAHALGLRRQSGGSASQALQPERGVSSGPAGPPTAAAPARLPAAPERGAGSEVVPEARTLALQLMTPDGALPLTLSVYPDPRDHWRDQPRRPSAGDDSDDEALPHFALHIRFPLLGETALAGRLDQTHLSLRWTSARPVPPELVSSARAVLIAAAADHGLSAQLRCYSEGS